MERSVRQHRHKNLVLILAREFASNLATPIYIADADESLVYFNEPAEQIAGRSFAETGEIPVREFTEMLAPQATDGHPLRREETPGGRTAFPFPFGAAPRPKPRFRVVRMKESGQHWLL